MDVPPDAGVGASGAERLVASPPARVTPAEVAERLEVVEAQLIDLGARLDALNASLPSVVQAAVADEVGAMSGELRHTVSQLGRLLVRDLGRLSQILAEHRDTIVAELRVAPPPPADRVENHEEGESNDEPAADDEEGSEEEASKDVENDEEGSEDRTWLRRRRAR